LASSEGFTVLRFPNSAVSNRPNDVVTAILKVIERPTTSTYDDPSDRWALDTGAPLPPAYLRVKRPEGG